MPILNGEQPEDVEDSEVALNDPGCIARAHPTAALLDSDPGLLNHRACFGFYTHSMASSPVIGQSELI